MGPVSPLRVAGKMETGIASSQVSPEGGGTNSTVSVYAPLWVSVELLQPSTMM